VRNEPHRSRGCRDENQPELRSSATNARRCCGGRAGRAVVPLGGGVLDAGIIKDWITSGVPISQPAPDALARELLADRGLRLFLDSSVGPSTLNRHGIGYVSRNAELIRLAYLLLDEAAEIEIHPVTLATRWIMAGFSPNAATRRIREGVYFPRTG
jgi:hypothetical protein